VKFVEPITDPILCRLFINRRNWHFFWVSFLVLIGNMTDLLIRAENVLSRLFCMINALSHLWCSNHVLGVKYWSYLPILNIGWGTALINLRIDNMNVGSSNFLRKLMFIFLKKLLIFYLWDLILDVWIGDLIRSFRPRIIDDYLIIMSFLLMFRNILGRRFLHSIKSLHIYISSTIEAYCLREHREAAFEFLLSSKLIIKERYVSRGSATSILCFVGIFIELFDSVLLEAHLAKGSCDSNELSFLRIFLWGQNAFNVIRLEHFVLHTLFIFHDLPAF
jgi:hypothetical protein